MLRGSAGPVSCPITTERRLLMDSSTRFRVGLYTLSPSCFYLALVGFWIGSNRHGLPQHPPSSTRRLRVTTARAWGQIRVWCPPREQNEQVHKAFCSITDCDPGSRRAG